MGLTFIQDNLSKQKGITFLLKNWDQSVTPDKKRSHGLLSCGTLVLGW